MATANLKHTWTLNIKNDSGASVVADTPLVITGDAETNFSVIVAPSETAEVDAAVVVADIKSAFLSSNQAVTVNTNAADATGGQTFAIPAARSISWNNQEAATNPFTIDVTKFFIINSGTTNATVRGGFLLQE